MSRVRFTPAAERDLEELIDYVLGQSGPERAAILLGELLDAADRLAEHPRMGHVREDLTSEPVLFWAVHSILLVYRPETAPLEFVCVVSGWRAIRSVLAGGRGDR